ncbi:MAG: alpha/beta hydrolase [Brotaphodocola sp.]
MSMKGWLTKAAAAGALGAAGEYTLARCLVRRTLLRGRATLERTAKMSGTDWNQYVPKIRAWRERSEQLPKEDVYTVSDDGLKLHGTWFPYEGSNRVVICFHGYTSSGMNDYAAIAEYYRSQGFHLLLVDERAHGGSEGKYIGFGCLDRYDVRCWVNDVIRRMGEDCQIMLHGVSMGGAAVLMASGLKLPEQVKGIISDCAFTSAWDIFASVLKGTYHLPAFPLLNLMDIVAKKEAGYGLKECDAREEVKKAAIPIAFIHGDADTFVPFSMVSDLYEACASEKELMVVKGAGHLEACYMDPEGYADLIAAWTRRYFTDSSKTI